MERIIDIEYNLDISDYEKELEKSFIEDYFNYDLNYGIDRYEGNINDHSCYLFIEFSSGDIITFQYDMGNEFNESEYFININDNDLSEYGPTYMQDLGWGIEYFIEIPIRIYEDFVSKNLKED